jgi:hypothetical protein
MAREPDTQMLWQRMSISPKVLLGASSEYELPRHLVFFQTVGELIDAQRPFEHHLQETSLKSVLKNAS